MAKKQMTLVYYYVPEDKDDPQYPNVFGIMMPKANIRYEDIEKNFPLRGQYIFRFKVMHENSLVWLDLADKTSKLPTYKDRIYVKATRITWEINNKESTLKKQQQSTKKQPIKTESASTNDFLI